MSKASDKRDLRAFIDREIEGGYIKPMAKATLTLKVARLIDLSLAEHYHCEMVCSDERYCKQLEAREAESAARIAEVRRLIITDLGFTGLYVNGDPRGCPFGILSKSERYNGMGGKECGWRF